MPPFPCRNGNPFGLCPFPLSGEFPRGEGKFPIYGCIYRQRPSFCGRPVEVLSKRWSVHEHRLDYSTHATALQEQIYLRLAKRHCWSPLRKTEILSVWYLVSGTSLRCRKSILISEREEQAPFPTREEQAPPLQPTTNHQPPTTNYQLPTTNHQLPTTNCQLPTTNCQLPTTNYQLPTINYQPPTTNHQLPTTNYQPPTTNYQLPTTNYQPPTTNHQRHKKSCPFRNSLLKSLILLFSDSRT